jgi:O-methyltransferase involved in polyketide biosynthesis
MVEKIVQTLDGVSETLLMTLYVRARESQRPDGMIKDEKAVAMVNRIACDFSRLRMQRHDEVAVIMRMKKFDSHVRDFFVRNPHAVVVHIGCGLDTRFDRVDNGLVEWFDLDMPDVIELRQKLIGNEYERYHTLSTSVFDDDWMEAVSRLKPCPFLFIAEGVLPYFEESQVKSLVLKLRDHFRGSELVCDAHTPFVIWADNLHLAFARVKARLQWSLRHGRDVEGWGDAICLLDEWNYFEDDESPLKAFRWVRLIPPLAKSSGIFHYRLGLDAHHDPGRKRGQMRLPLQKGRSDGCSSISSNAVCRCVGGQL